MLGTQLEEVLTSKTDPPPLRPRYRISAPSNCVDAWSMFNHGGEQDYSVRSVEVVNKGAVCSGLREYQKNWLPGYVSSTPRPDLSLLESI